MRQTNQPVERRTFLKAAATLGAVGLGARVAAGPVATSAAATPIGVLLGTFGGNSLEARLDAARACGITCVQVSLGCVGLPEMPDEITPEVAGHIRRAAAERGLDVVSVQGTFNMSHPDPEHRKTGLRRLGVLAEACAAMGTSKIHICTGTRDPNDMWRRHPDNTSPAAWRDMVACVGAASAIAGKAHVVLAFEPEVNNVVNSARKARQLIDEVGSPALKVTIDPANLFHKGELPRMKEILDEAFDLIGKDVVLAHAKDLDHDDDAGHLPAGHGKLDYARYVTLLHRLERPVPLLLHGLSAGQVPDCVAFLREKIARVDAPR